MATKKDTKATKSAKTATTGKASNVWSDDERAAMRERAKELKAEARANKDKEQGEKDMLAKIAALPGTDKTMAKRLYAIVKENAPSLSPKTWYGMPAFANKEGKIVCFFTPASKFKTRYATFGFNDDANLDEGGMWATSFALKEMTGVEEARLAELVKKAVS